MIGVLHVPAAPLCSGLGCGAEWAGPLRLRISETDVRRFSVDCILRNIGRRGV